MLYANKLYSAFAFDLRILRLILSKLKITKLLILLLRIVDIDDFPEPLGQSSNII
jgi:hypothetical protein